MPYEKEELNKAFETLVRWCINGKVQELDKAIKDEKNSIFGDLFRFKYECVDSKTGHNIIEFAAISGNTEIMRILQKHRFMREHYLDVGKAMKYAIVQDGAWLGLTPSTLFLKMLPIS